MRALVAFFVISVLVAVGACTAPRDPGPERFVTTGTGGLETVHYLDVETDFQRLASPGHLTFIELAGKHCGGCEKNKKIFEKLAQVRPDVAVRIVPFPDELCPDHPDDAQRRACREVVAATRELGGCFTPTLWAIAPDGRLLARDDTCRDQRPAAELFHAFADRELAATTTGGT